MDNKTPIFYGQVEGGELKLANKEVFKRYLKLLDGLVTVVVKKKRNSRSLPQNSYYWGGVLTTIAYEIGEDDIESLHEYFKNEYLLRVKQVANKKTGELTEIKMSRSTTKLDTVQFTEYLDKVVRWAAKMGIIVLTPEEYYALN